MYTGQVDSVTNQEDWVSDFYELIDDDTGNVINILNNNVGFSGTVTIRERESNEQRLSASVTVSANDAGEAGFQWTFTKAQMSALRARTYNCYVTVVENGITRDLIVGTLAVLQGNAQP